MVFWAPEPTERSARQPRTRAPPLQIWATGKAIRAVPSPTGPSRPAGSRPTPPSTHCVQRQGEALPAGSAPLEMGGSPRLAAAWHSKKLDRLVLASEGWHLLGSPALVSELGSQQSFLAERRQARPAFERGRLAARRPFSRTGAGWLWLATLSVKAPLFCLLLWTHRALWILEKWSPNSQKTSCCEFFLFPLSGKAVLSRLSRLVPERFHREGLFLRTDAPLPCISEQISFLDCQGEPYVRA